MTLRELNGKTYDKEFLLDDELKIVFVGTSWCLHCQAMKPSVTDFAMNNPEINVYTVDGDTSGDLLEKMDIKAIPTTLVYKSGKEVKRNVGTLTKKEFATFIAEAQ